MVFAKAGRGLGKLVKAANSPAGQAVVEGGKDLLKKKLGGKTKPEEAEEILKPKDKSGGVSESADAVTAKDTPTKAEAAAVVAKEADAKAPAPDPGGGKTTKSGGEAESPITGQTPAPKDKGGSKDKDAGTAKDADEANKKIGAEIEKACPEPGTGWKGKISVEIPLTKEDKASGKDKGKGYAKFTVSGKADRGKAKFELASSGAIELGGKWGKEDDGGQLKAGLQAEVGAKAVGDSAKECIDLLGLLLKRRIEKVPGGKWLAGKLYSENYDEDVLEAMDGEDSVAGHTKAGLFLGHSAKNDKDKGKGGHGRKSGWKRSTKLTAVEKEAEVETDEDGNVIGGTQGGKELKVKTERALYLVDEYEVPYKGGSVKAKFDGASKYDRKKGFGYMDGKMSFTVKDKDAGGPLASAFKDARWKLMEKVLKAAKRKSAGKGKKNREDLQSKASSVFHGLPDEAFKKVTELAKPDKDQKAYGELELEFGFKGGQYTGFKIKKSESYKKKDIDLGLGDKAKVEAETASSKVLFEGKPDKKKA